MSLRNAVIVFFNTVYQPTLWIHESSHIVDQFAIPVNGGRYSQSQAWLDAIAADPDVPDPYSNSNSVEDFAQVADIAMFDKNVPGGFGTVEANPSAVFHQYSAVEGVLGSTLVRGGFCTRRWADSATVAMPGTTASRLTASTKPEFMPLSGSPSLTPPVVIHETPEMDIIHDVDLVQ
ncbi:hypothetical protein C8J56DRAFT_970316 [Mycena floridula]|nr:hypothetical protein C8J56DRAFT_970316 [Mycena floridula]